MHAAAGLPRFGLELVEQPEDLGVVRAAVEDVAEHHQLTAPELPAELRVDDAVLLCSMATRSSYSPWVSATTNNGALPEMRISSGAGFAGPRSLTWNAGRLPTAFTVIDAPAASDCARLRGTPAASSTVTACQPAPSFST